MEIGFVLFPGVTQLDFTGPLQVLNRAPGGRTHILAKSMAPVATDTPLTLNPTATFAEAPRLDLICVPGGFGVAEAMQDAETVDFVRRAGGQARYVTSVCTGAFLLGAAGLLRGKRATTHWAYHHLLPRVGAEAVKARVVSDGGVITGGGVTAGIDFAFAVMAEIAGEDVARRLQVILEYDPEPPFRTTIDTASPAVREQVNALFDARMPDFAARLDAAVGQLQPAQRTP